MNRTFEQLHERVSYRRVHNFEAYTELAALGKAKMRIVPIVEITLKVMDATTQEDFAEPGFHMHSVRVTPIMITQEKAATIKTPSYILCGDNLNEGMPV
jgi:hypothetical protein